jgi:hypothetical protein
VEEVGFVFPMKLSVVAAPFPPFIKGSLTNVSLKCCSNNFEPHEVRRIKLFITESPRR